MIQVTSFAIQFVLCQRFRAFLTKGFALKRENIEGRPSRDEVTGEWRRLHNEELNGLYPSPNIVRVIKSRRMRWAGHVARMGEERETYRVLVGETGGKETAGET